jgi:EEF1A lysine methyltransferase 1
MDLFTEDWNASQFWYSDETATRLACALLADSTPETRIAVVSAPSVFLQLKNLLSSQDANSRPQIHLLEFDERFSVFGSQFVKYDFQAPTKLPSELKASFDRIIVDPPFLSSDCQTKAALTVRWLTRTWSPSELKLIVCTGERMEELIHKLYGKAGVRTTDFEPVHAKGLSNEFRCYANFEEGWRFR